MNTIAHLSLGLSSIPASQATQHTAPQILTSALRHSSPNTDKEIKMKNIEQKVIEETKLFG